MSAHSRRKGRRGENEAAAVLGDAERVSEAGSPGTDLIWRDRTVEVKRRNTTQGFALIERMLADAQVAMVRADRGEWLVAMRPETLLDLLDEASLLIEPPHDGVHDPGGQTDDGDDVGEQE